MKLEELNPAQQEAVKHFGSPLLVLSAAGSGKTSVITSKIIHLVDSYNINLDNILAITFTNKAANEMRNRVIKSLDLQREPQWITTFHSMATKILRRDVEHLGINRDFVIYDEKESEKVVRLLLKDMGLNKDLYNPGNIKDAISKVKQSMSPNLFDYYNMEFPDFQNIFEAYNNQLRASNAMDFDDLLLFAVDLFKNVPEVLGLWRDRFRHVLVDEYQDTNKMQHDLLVLLLGDNQNITVVGDVNQLIYSWRGAHPDNILKFDEEFPNTKVIKLERNYRSPKNVLTVANNVVSRLAGSWKNKSIRMWTDKQNLDDIILREFYDRVDEASWVAREISKLKAIRKYNYSDFVILTRLTSLTHKFEDALMGLKIPYQVVGGLRFGQRKEVRDMISYLSLVHNPNDEIAFTRIINVPSRGIGDMAIAKIKEQDGSTYVERMLNSMSVLSKKQKSEVDRLVNTLEFVKQKSNECPCDALMYIYNSIGYETYLKDKFKREALDRIGNVKQLMSTLKTIQLTGKTLTTFMEESKLVSDQDDIDEKNSVKIMTIHAVKGLEFKTVFVVGLEEGVLPCKMAFMSEQLEEERRLFYVAITRPIDSLRLSYSTSEFDASMMGRREIRPSRYIKDVKDYVKFI